MLRVTMDTLVVVICLAVTAHVNAEDEGSKQHYQPGPKQYYPRSKHYRPEPVHFIEGSKHMYLTLSELKEMEVRVSGLEDYMTAVEDAVPPPDGTLRIIGEDGNDSDKGRLEIIFFGMWGTLCENNWNKDTAIVACNQMGKPSGDPEVLRDIEDTYGAVPKLPIWLDILRCSNPSFERIIDCDYREFWDVFCDHNKDIGLHCKD